QSDAENDAAVILLEMRRRWKPERAEHFEIDRQERMIVAWARLRLIDKYETEFARQKMTRPLNAAGGVGSGGAMWPSDQNPRNGWSRAFGGNNGTSIDVEAGERDVPDKRPKRISELDREEIRQMVARLPERQSAAVRFLLFEGMTQ